MPNHVRFFAITADDLERARTFYEAVFAWKFEDWGPPDFHVIQGAGISGALQARAEPLAAGALTMQTSHIETVGTLIYFIDTEGNRVGAIKYDN